MMELNSSDELLLGQHVFDSNADEPSSLQSTDLQAVLSLCSKKDSEYAADENIELEREQLDWDSMLFESHSKDVEDATPCTPPTNFYEVDATASACPCSFRQVATPYSARQRRWRGMRAIGTRVAIAGGWPAPPETDLSRVEPVCLV
jgi:hypothetical protein